MSRSGPNDAPAARGRTGLARFPSDSTATHSFPGEYERGKHARGIAAVGSERTSVAARDALACAESITRSGFGYCDSCTSDSQADNDKGLRICRLRNRRRKGPQRIGRGGPAMPASPLPRRSRSSRGIGSSRRRFTRRVANENSKQGDSTDCWSNALCNGNLHGSRRAGSDVRP